MRSELEQKPLRGKLLVTARNLYIQIKMVHKVSNNIMKKISIFICILLSAIRVFGDDTKKYQQGNGEMRQEKGWVHFQASFLSGNWKQLLPGNSEKWCKTYTSQSPHPREKEAKVFIHQLLSLYDGGLLLGSIILLSTYRAHKQ